MGLLEEFTKHVLGVGFEVRLPDEPCFGQATAHRYPQARKGRTKLEASIDNGGASCCEHVRRLMSRIRLRLMSIFFFVREVGG